MKLKLSYSIINIWKSKDYDRALEALLGHWRAPSEDMLYGTKMHKEWEEEVNRTGCMPVIFGGERLENPITEEYCKTRLLDWLWLVGMIDLQFIRDNDKYLVDYKTGKGGAGQYGSSLQAGCYKILKPSAKLFMFKHYNQYEEKTSTCVIKLTDRLLNNSLSQVITIGEEIREMLINRGLDDFNNLDRRKND